MNRLTKISVLVCLTAVMVYFAGAHIVGGKEAPHGAKPKVRGPRPLGLLTGRAPAIPLPAGFQSPGAGARAHTLTLSSSVPPSQFVTFEQQLLTFLQNGEDKQLGWCGDKGVRDTGPFRNGVYYTTAATGSRQIKADVVVTGNGRLEAEDCRC